jgi:hypothetical protein
MPHEEEITLAAFANELGMDNEAMNKLIDQHFGTKGWWAPFQAVKADFRACFELDKGNVQMLD